MNVKENRPALLKPGLFGIEAAADRRRNEFDFHNEALLHHQRKIDFVFFGDSITHWWDVDTYFGGAGRVIVNRGIGGDTTAFALRRFAADVVQLRPAYAIILLGINNTWALDEWLPEDRKQPEHIQQEIVDDLAAMLTQARENGIAPILCSLLPTRMERCAKNSLRNELVASINKALQEYARAENIIFVDYHRHMTDEDGLTLREELADDGLHPHVLGYDLMARALRETLAAHGIEIG
ncbi:GDSL-type esterase/lipase family protein [Brevibacillus borstelensis]|uniref:GDSL-type esterase/lipase family protein n=1 Tax=Brevibacillus borstelensis TaxID=45462 RepID=UPI001D0B5E83|nr:GDSL-type esterase/lipase family protein [Brevibacillus borstelensis]MCC0567191.1 GDSL-type esterase/lipase family protein [Brevibacillus borstelensis]